MPLIATNDNSPSTFPKPDYLTFGSFKRGVITLVEKSFLPLDALETADNIFLVEQGQPSIRPGTNWYGAVMPNGQSIDGFDYFDFNGVIHLVAVAGGTIYRSTNDGGTWTACTGATVTAGMRVYLNQYNNFLYLTNGIDIITRYDGTTTLQQYASLSTPSAPTAVVTGMTGTTYTTYYKISAVSQIGFSAASSKLTVQASQSRDTYDSTHYVTLTTPAPVTNQTRFDIYFSTDDLNYYYLDSIVSSTANPSVTYKDDGTAVVISSTTAPTSNTTQGPMVVELSNVGSRMYGVRDPNNRYRISFTSGAAPYGSFSSGYDGGYLDWQPGGKFIPVHVEDYRDGKGTPLATIWCSSADGRGCIIQMSLDTLTIGNISITVPSAFKLPGSRGTNAPGSVVNVLNDYMFENSQAFYNLGNRQNSPVPILSTDEISANIRPTVKTISHAGESGIASTYFDAKVYFSVPYGDTVNNTTTVYDTERKAWLPKAFTIGFKHFLRYTDTASSQHLLAVKPGDNQLSEISSNFQGDYGVAFNTDLLTGLLPVAKDRFQFQFTEEMEWEFSNPNGSIFVEILGIERSKGFGSIRLAPVNIVSGVSATGWDNYPWDTLMWDNTSVVPEVTSESSAKRYTPVQKSLNAIQWHVYTNSIDAKYILRTLQTWGTPDEGGKPSQWRVKSI